MIMVSNRPGRTDIGTTEAGNTVIKLCNDRLVALFIKAETFGGTDIETELAAPTGLFFYGHFEHFYLLMRRIISPLWVIITSRAIFPTAWVEQARQGS